MIYQVSWAKSLGLLFGHTVYASATVLAVFMGGLAAGSAWLGRWSERTKRPIALYGWIELGVAASGALSLAGIAAIRALYLSAAPAITGSAPLLLALRFLGASIVLFVPTFLMGGTLPVLVRGLTRNSSELSARVSRLYWVNTLGAVAGTLAAGFGFLPSMGLRLTVVVAVVLNVLAGIVALRLAPRWEAPPERQIGPDEAAVSSPTGSLSFLLLCFALVGGTAIAYEIAWARVLSTILGSSTYAFTLMLATFLAGIVLGSFLFERWSARHSVTLATFARTQTLTALAAMLFLVFFRELPGIVPPILRATHETFGGLVLAQFVASALAMLPAAIVFGFNFPAVVALVAGSPLRAGRAGETVGRAYAANTFGAILAAIATGFFLVPWIGSFRVVALAGLLNLLLAIALELRCFPRRVYILVANAALAAATLYTGWSPVFYDRALAAFGTVLYWNYRGVPLTLDEAAQTEDILFLEDGLNATIAVARSDDYVALKTNGKVDASTSDIPTQLLLGDLGAIFHSHPRRALVIGFGSGMTASALARFPDVERIDCIEIEPAVLRAAPYLSRLNRGVLSDPRLHIILDDARNALLTSRDVYDLIVSEPSNPWIAGIAALFTDEFYAAARSRLAPGGMFVQWVQGYSLDPADLRMILASLAPHFSDVTLWHSSTADFVILARTETHPFDFSRARKLWSNPQLREDFSSLRLTRPESWPVYFRLGDAEVRALASGGEKNTDDGTLLEYRAPRAMVGRARTEDLEAAIERMRRGGPLPPSLSSTETPTALLAAAESSLELHEDRSGEYVRALAGAAPTASLEVVRGRQALRENRIEEAISHFERALCLDPNEYSSLYWLALARHITPNDTRAEAILERFLELRPKDLEALAARIEFAKDRKDWSAAVQAQTEKLAAMTDPPASEYCRLADLLSRVGNPEAAERALRTGLEHEPYSYLCHRGLGEIARLKGQLDEARQHYEHVVRHYPDADPSIYPALAAVYRSQGHSKISEEILRKGRRIFPNDPELAKMLPRN